MTFETVTLLVRSVNLLLWLLLAWRVLVTSRPLTPLARRAIALVIVFGMSAFVIGALVPFGMPGKTANLVYTAFATFAAMIALGLISTGEPNGGDDE